MNVQTLTAAPGDVIVITVPELLTQPQRDRLEAHIVALVADTRVLILDGGVQMAVLKRPTPDAGVLTVAVAGKVEENEIVQRAPAAPKGRRQVEHVEAEEDDTPTPYVWLYRNMLTELQAVAPLGRDETNGQYAVAVDQLTDEQRAIPHVRSQLDEQNNDM